MSSTAATSPAGDRPVDRAVFHDPANFFAFRWPPVPRRQFLAERDRAFDADAPTGFVPLDASDALGTTYPATTPLLLASYASVRAGERLGGRLRASAALYYVMRGRGTSTGGDERIDWGPGDVFCFPGGHETLHAAENDAVLFSVTNEPLLAFEALEPPPPGAARIDAVHWTADAIDAQFRALHARPKDPNATGQAVQLSSRAMAPARHTIPSMNAALNSLEPGGDQTPHRHNGVAITLAIEGEGVYSMIEDERVDWANGAAQITPATELHSHHNRGSARMMSLVVQDEGLHFYTRTPGFSWT